MIKKILDTSVIIRYLTRDNLEHYKISRDFFDLVKLGRVRAYLEQTVFTEIVFVLSSKNYQVPKEEICDALYDLLIYKGIYNPEKEVLLEGLNIYAKNNLSIVDSIIAAKAQFEGAEIESFDKELLKYSNATIENNNQANE